MSADGQSLDGLSFSLYSNLCLCLSFAQEHFWVKNFELHGGEHSSTGGHAYLREVVSIGSLSPLLGILAKVISIGSWDLLDSLDFISFFVFLPSFLLSFLPSFLPFFLSSFLFQTRFLCLGPHSVDQAGLEFRKLLASASQVLG